MNVQGLKKIPVAIGINYNLHINCNLDTTIKFGWPLPFSELAFTCRLKNIIREVA